MSAIWTSLLRLLCIYCWKAEHFHAACCSTVTFRPYISVPFSSIKGGFTCECCSKDHLSFFPVYLASVSSVFTGSFTQRYLYKCKPACYCIEENFAGFNFVDCQYLPFCRFNFCRLAHLHPVCTVQLNLFRRLLCAGRRLSAKTLRLGPSKISCYMVYLCTARSRLDTTLVCETSDASTLYIHCTGYTVIRSSSTRRWSVHRLNVPTEWDQCWY